MPRYKEYDSQTVLKRASEVFHRKGFEGTSMTDLVAATGLNTASMYKEFGSKEGLFESSLELYNNTHILSMVQEMQATPNLASLKAYLNNLQTYSTSNNFLGCLIMNNLAEKNIATSAALEHVENLCGRLEELIEACLVQAQQDGDIPTYKDPKELANFIICFVHGLVLYARMDDRKANMHGIFDQIENAIVS